MRAPVHLGLVNKLSSIFGWLRRAVAKAALARRRLRLAVSALSSLSQKRNLISLPVLMPFGTIEKCAESAILPTSDSKNMLYCGGQLF